MSAAERMDLWFLFFAYSAVFVIFFGFMMRMLRISRRLEQEVALLRREWDGESAPAAPPPAVKPTARSRVP